MRHRAPASSKKAREAVIVFTVSGYRFAMAAGAVSEIRGTDGLQPFVPRASSIRSPRPEYTLERAGRTFFVVSAATHFHLNHANPGRILILRQLSAAVLVDSTDRMMEISVLHALPQAFTREERNWYRGLTLLNDEVVPVVNHQAFLSRAEQAVLKTEMERGVGRA